MRVRVNSIYRFNPNGWDRVRPCGDLLKPGDLVRVVNLHGCPPANTMGQCYVRLVGGDGKAFQMVSTDSLGKTVAEEDRTRARGSAGTLEGVGSHGR